MESAANWNSFFTGWLKCSGISSHDNYTSLSDFKKSLNYILVNDEFYFLDLYSNKDIFGNQYNLPN